MPRICDGKMANVKLFFRIVVSIFYISISFSAQEDIFSSRDSIIVKILKGLNLEEKTLTLEQYKFLASHQQTISNLKLKHSIAVADLKLSKLENYNAEDYEYIAKMYHCAYSLRTVIEMASVMNLLNPKGTTETVNEMTECVLKEIESRTKSLKEIFKNLLYNVIKRYMGELKPKFEKAYDNLKLLDLIQQPADQSVNCRQLYEILFKLKISQNCEDGWKIYVKQNDIIWKNIIYKVDKNKNIEGTVKFSTDFQNLIGETTNQEKWTKPVIKLIKVNELNSTLFNYFVRQRDNLTNFNLDKFANLDEIFKDSEDIKVNRDLAKAILDLVNEDDSDSTAYQVFLDNEEWITWARKYENEDQSKSYLPVTAHENTVNKMTDIHLEGAKSYAVKQCSDGKTDYKLLVRVFVIFLRKNKKSHWSNRLQECVGTVIESDSKGFRRIIDDLRDTAIIKNTAWKDLSEEEIVLKACTKVALLHNTVSSFVDIHGVLNSALPKGCKVEESDYRTFVNSFSVDSDTKDVAVVLSRLCPKHGADKKISDKP